MTRRGVMLEGRNLFVSLADRSQRSFITTPLRPILRDVGIQIGTGEAVGLVGESGSGKSTLGRTLLRLYEPISGQILFEGVDVAQAAESELRWLRQRVQMVFQDSRSTLNPRRKILDTLAAPFIAHGLASKMEARRHAMALIERVGLTAGQADRYPHQLSGGQRQRVNIARALALDPAILIADEIVSGLDVSIQAQIVELLIGLKTDRKMGLLFISHDLSVVRLLCERIIVMHNGAIVEAGRSDELFENPRSDYTRKLLRSAPSPIVDAGWLDVPLEP